MAKNKAAQDMVKLRNQKKKYGKKWRTENASKAAMTRWSKRLV